ncbi:MAG: hypothetical protein I3274_02835 [Candidatus Moeniiplasma glomeromycotorum]|nr:hypothetical protein [Candidatus Moeniiplasma glomeromycotorum]MCE8167541.1 hypothetical protein [Candidatus Moeniiplasma glomeromycotorum]
MNEKKIESKNGFPDPVKAKCFKCQKEFWIKFVVPQRNYSLKNSWDYWTNQKENKGKKICNDCLRKLYLQEKKNYLTTIKDLKKRKILGSYVSSNSV